MGTCTLFSEYFQTVVLIREKGFLFSSFVAPKFLSVAKLLNMTYQNASDGMRGRMFCMAHYVQC